MTPTFSLWGREIATGEFLGLAGHQSGSGPGRNPVLREEIWES